MESGVLGHFLFCSYAQKNKEKRAIKRAQKNEEKNGIFTRKKCGELCVVNGK